MGAEDAHFLCSSCQPASHWLPLHFLSEPLIMTLIRTVQSLVALALVLRLEVLQTLIILMPDCSSGFSNLLPVKVAYHSIRNTFMEELDKLLGGSFEEFSNFNRTGFILGCENWDRYDFKALLKLVKSFVVLVWDTRKNNYMVLVQPLVALALVL